MARIGRDFGRNLGRHRARVGGWVLRYATAGAAALGVLAVGGTAVAQWSTSGSGSGSAATASGNSTALTTTALTPSGTQLAPGLSAPLTLRIDNPNSFPVTVTALSLDTSRAIGVGTATGCADPALTVSASGWSGVTVPAGGNSGTITIPGAVSMGAGADNGCQGATFTIPVTLTGQN